MQGMIERDGEWWYAKVYLKPQRQDAFLEQVVRPLAEIHRSSERQWFFVRYSHHAELLEHAGPAIPPVPSLQGHHLRIRVRSESTADQVWQDTILEAARREAHSGSRTTVARYEPEVARYGGHVGVEIAHELFTVDSLIALTLLRRIRRDALVAAITSCDLLVRLGLSRDEVTAVYDEHVNWISNLFERGSVTRQLLASQAEQALSGSEQRVGEARDTVRACPAYRSAAGRLGAIGDRWCEADRCGQLSRPLREICIDLQHMHFNRLGLSPRQELSAVLLADAALRRALLP